VKSGIQLAKLRDAYHEAHDGTLEPLVPENVLPMEAKNVHSRVKAAGGKGLV